MTTKQEKERERKRGRYNINRILSWARPCRPKDQEGREEGTVCPARPLATDGGRRPSRVLYRRHTQRGRSARLARHRPASADGRRVSCTGATRSGDGRPRSPAVDRRRPTAVTCLKLPAGERVGPARPSAASGRAGRPRSPAGG